MSCKFCEDRITLPGWGDAMEMKIVDVQPMPAIDLSTGEVEVNAQDAYCALSVYYIGDEFEMDSFRVNFCPICGDKLQANVPDWLSSMTNNNDWKRRMVLE